MSEKSEYWLEINWYEEYACELGDELDHIAFEVENLETALAELKSKGIEPVSYT